MVSFGFYGSPTTIPLKEYSSLANLGFDDTGFISESFHSDYYIFGEYIPLNTEKKVINICKFLQVDRVDVPRMNSLMDTNLKGDAVLIHGEFATFFQAKSSLRVLELYKKKYGNKELNPYFSKRNYNYDHLPRVQKSYLAPGAVYLDVTQGNQSLSQFLWEFSKWSNIPIKEEYKTLLSILLKSKKPLAIKTLETILGTKEIVSRVAQLKTIYPITFMDGYVQIKEHQKVG